MKKRLFIVTLLLISVFAFLANDFSFNKREMGVRNIYVENNDFDLSYLDDKYNIFDTENNSIEIFETYSSSMDNISNTSLEGEYKIDYNVCINKNENYFTFSYILYEYEEITLTSSVNINIFEHENEYYFLSSNGCITPCNEIYDTSNLGQCAAFSYACYNDGLGLNLLNDWFGFGGGGGGAALGAALGAAAGIALIDTTINNSNSSSISGTGVSSSSSAASGSLTPNNNNNKKSDKDKTKELSDEISDDYKTNGKCDQYADALENKMKENNISGERIKVTPKTGQDIIYSDKFGVIGDNGYHDAIKVGDYIFDNMNPNGVPYSEWVSDLGGDIYNLFEIIRSW